MTGTSDRKKCIADARRYTAACAKQGAQWDAVWSQVQAGVERAGVTLTSEEKFELYDAWDAAYPWPEETAA